MATHNEATMLPGHMVDAIRTASGCHDTCMESIVHCLKLGGEHANASHIRLLIDCAAICEQAANFMLRSSDYHGRVCGVCADICEACASDCGRFQNDNMMQQCAELCRLCAQSCREMA